MDTAEKKPMIQVIAEKAVAPTETGGASITYPQVRLVAIQLLKFEPELVPLGRATFLDVAHGAPDRVCGQSRKRNASW